jgi:hypothetical protein
MSLRRITIDVSVCVALALSCAAVEAQTGSTTRVASSKRANAAASMAEKGQRALLSSSGWHPNPLLGAPPPYDDSKLADLGAPVEPPAPQPYEALDDAPPTPTERMAIAAARGVEHESGTGSGPGLKTRRSSLAASADAGTESIYSGNVYSQSGPNTPSVYPLPW